jgi:hypothetical protein
LGAIERERGLAMLCVIRYSTSKALLYSVRTERSERLDHTAIDYQTRRDSREPRTATEVSPTHSILVLFQIS